MANHNLPTLTSTYANFVSEMDARMDDISISFDPVLTTATNFPTGTVRWVSGSNKWEKWSGSAWADLSSAYAINISGNAATVTNGVYTSATYANPTWITSIAGTKVSGAISGNAGTATQLANPRNINGVAFDGTAAISINLNTAATFNNGGAGAVSGSTFNGSAALTVSYNTVGAPSTSGTNATGTWAISITGSAAQLNGQSASYYQTALGFTPVQQGGGTSQLSNKVYIGWLGSQLGLTVDTTNFGSSWPISVSSLSTATGNAPSYSARAWVNFNGQPALGTYSRAGFVITCTLPSHGMVTDQKVNLNFAAGTGGTATNGNYTVTVINTTTFTVTDTVSGTISGAPGFTRQTFIRSSGNVTSITDFNVGIYGINFSTAMPDANYSVSGMVDLLPTGNTCFTSSMAAGGFTIYVTRPGFGENSDPSTVSIVVHR